MYLRTTNASKSSLASTSSTRYYLQQHSFQNRSGTTPMSPRPSSPPPPVPSVTASTSTTNLASALRKGMMSSSSHSNSGEYVQSRASIDQVRTSVERATASASASPRVESKLRMSTDRTRS
jgi:alkanesulfonate monooxygenase SsuD/methylene tetrahydromethanopterin reductase-like flavin-dependent oxidoreductase (luciferase family)